MLLDIKKLNNVKDDIAEVRKAIYGLDMRVPLADALTSLKNYYTSEGIVVDSVANVSTEHLSGEYYLLKITVN